MDGSWSILEGDDRIYVDGEATPSFHGTGLEDYFNGAWYYDGLFNRPLHGLVEKAPIRTSQYRFHLPDRIGFERSLSFTFEFGDANRARGYMSSVAYWYQDEPRAATPALPPADRRFPPADPLEPYAIVCRLIELERIGRLDEAVLACREYAARFADSPWAPVLELRALAYLEKLHGFLAVRDSYQKFAELPGYPALAQQAQNLLWFNASPTNALLGINSFGRFRAYLDGQLVGEGDNPSLLSVYPVTLEPGEHTLGLEITPTRPDAFVLVDLRCHGTNILSDTLWEYTRRRPPNWPDLTEPHREWQPVPVEHTNHKLPKMIYWQFVPTAYIGMQSGQQGIRPWASWHSDGITAYLRRRFVIPRAASAAPGE